MAEAKYLEGQARAHGAVLFVDTDDALVIFSFPRFPPSLNDKLKKYAHAIKWFLKVNALAHYDAPPP